MIPSLYPNFNLGRSSIEVVDERNTPIGVMHYTDIARQRLRHRSVAILLRDAGGRFLLNYYKKNGWSFSPVVPVPAGQSCETCATILLHEQWGIQTRIFPLGIYPPCRENGNCFVAVFEARLPRALIPGLTGSPERYLLLDYDELKGLSTHFRDMLTPYMHVLLQHGYVRP